jgi:hypothetical protein
MMWMRPPESRRGLKKLQNQEKTPARGSESAIDTIQYVS